MEARAGTKSNSANGKVSATTMRNSDLAIKPIVSARGEGINPFDSSAYSSGHTQG